MNVEIGAEAELFPEKEYISGIFVAVREYTSGPVPGIHKRASTGNTQEGQYLNTREGPVPEYTRVPVPGIQESVNNRNTQYQECKKVSVPGIHEKAST
jgi:hypothetical protein